MKTAYLQLTVPRAHTLCVYFLTMHLCLCVHELQEEVPLMTHEKSRTLGVILLLPCLYFFFQTSRF